MNHITWNLTSLKLTQHSTVSDIPIIKLFKSFTSTFKKADPSLILLPFQASKHHYSSISTLKQIKSLEEQKIYQFFKPYHQKQHYSLSGYFHISSELSLANILHSSSVDKWLDSYKYNVRVYPSQN